MTTWRQYIKNDIRRRIDVAERLPADLTLQGLAEEYRVSVTPVRQAVAELIEKGYLEKLENGRLAINPGKIGKSKASRDAAPPSPPRDLHGEIADYLVVLCLKGKPIFVREEETAVRYGVSGTAVRNVFSSLAGGGILEHIPRSGWRVRPFREKRLLSYSGVREVLEVEAMGLAWPHLVDADLQAMYDGNVLPKSEGEGPIIDNSLHDYLIDKADNEYIRDFFDRYVPLFLPFFHWEGMDRLAAIDTVRQHRAILAALLKRDRRAARKALAAHIRYDHATLKKKMLLESVLSEPEKKMPLESVLSEPERSLC